MSIFMGYRPCKQSCPGPDTVWQQQYLQLHKQRDVVKIDPRKFFLEDLEKAFLAKRQEGNEVLLGFYANAKIKTDRQFEIFAAKCSLYDLFQCLPHGNEAPNAYEKSQ